MRTLFAAVCLAHAAVAAAADPKPLNVLFIAVDDLRPELGCYGVPVVQSPSIDALAARGTLFRRAYCQQAVCNPSRVAVLTGLRPESSGVLDLPTFFRDKVPGAVTLPQHFVAHGYEARRFGKIFHVGQGNHDDPLSWSPRPGDPKPKAAAKKAAQPKKQANAKTVPPADDPDVADDKLQDGKVASDAIAAMKELKGKPFFLAVGFLKPHLPFVAPKKYWNLYDPAAIPPAPNPSLPAGAPPYASNNSGELRTYVGVPKQGAIPEADARRLKHGYYACVSYMDAQVGRVLAALDDLGLREDTVVVLWGDHGFQLGEHGTWTKHTAWEVATRAPLIVAVPGQKAAGQASDALVEFVDIFPTLAEVCGLPAVGAVQGASFAPLLADPARPWKSAAFSVWPKAIPGQGKGMGRAIRTDRYRLIEWKADGKPAAAYELYDHTADPGETVNLAAQADHEATVKELAAKLHAGWKAALPPGVSK